MEKKELRTVGVSGVEVKLNHSELVVLSGFVNRLSEHAEFLGTNFDEDDIDKFTLTKSSASDIAEGLHEATMFISKLLPKDIMSIEVAERELFGVGSKDEDDKPFDWNHQDNAKARKA